MPDVKTFRSPESKVIAFSALPALGKRLKAEGKTIVSTNGCFDLLHWGHCHYLRLAREQGDVLVVGLNSDDSVKKLKGPSRPLLDEKTRALQLASLEFVDYVAVFSEQTPERFLKELHSNIHVKGADYRDKPIPEVAIMQALGGSMAYVEFVEGLSTTSLVRKLGL